MCTRDFIPYEFVSQELHNSDQICLRASKSCNIPISTQKKSLRLSRKMSIKGRVEVRFSKHVFEGFLNVEDFYLRHNWNRRWCVLDGIFLYVWHDENTLHSNPLTVFDLRDTMKYLGYPLSIAPRELCARPRSFSLEYVSPKESESFRSSVYFSAASQKDLDDWLNNINIILDFINTWLC